MRPPASALPRHQRAVLPRRGVTQLQACSAGHSAEGPLQHTPPSLARRHSLAGGSHPSRLSGCTAARTAGHRDGDAEVQVGACGPCVIIPGIAGDDACSEDREERGYERRLQEGRRPSILEALGLWGAGVLNTPHSDRHQASCIDTHRPCAPALLPGFTFSLTLSDTLSSHLFCYFSLQLLLSFSSMRPGCCVFVFGFFFAVFYS